MEVKILNAKNSFNPEEINYLKKFLILLQDNMNLTKDIKIVFLDKKTNQMTTGVRKKNSEINVLSKGRLFIDILRTVAHEWVHEFQHQKLGLIDTSKVKDIGGPEENMANVLAGIMTKKFEKKYPKSKKVLYGN